MAKSLEVLIPTGVTCTAKLFTIGSDTAAETIGTLTEGTNRKGTATGTVTVTGWHKVIVFSGAVPVGDFIVNVGSTDPATYYAIDEAAVDWASVRNPTTTVGLSGTTVKTATDVETDTADIQARLPAALVGGRIDSNVGAISSDATAADNAESFFDGTGYAGTNNVIPLVTTTTTATNVTTVNGLAAGVITAASIAADAITDAKVASDVTIASVTGSVGSVTAAVTLPTIPTNWITADGIATDAIGSAELAASAVTEIQSGLSTLTSADINTALVAAGLVLNSTTIATLSSQTSFTLTAGSADNDAYNGCIVVITDASTSTQKAVGVISDYVGSTLTVTLANDPAVFTMAATDLVDIIPCRALKPTVDNRTIDVTATGAGGVDWGNVENATTAVNLSATNIDVDQVVASVTAAVTVGSMNANTLTASALAADAVTEIQSGLATPTNITAATGIVLSGVTHTGAVIPTVTNTGTLAGAATVVLTDASLTTAKLGTFALAKTTNITGFNDLSAAQVNTEVDTAIVDARLDELLAADSDIDGAAPPTVGSVFHELMSKTTGSFTFDQTTDSAEAIRDAVTSAGTALDAAGVRSAVGLASANLDTQLTAIDDLIDTEVAAIKSDTAAILLDTDSLDTTKITTARAAVLTDWIDGGRLDVILDARSSQASVDDVPTNAELTTAITALLTTQMTEAYAADGTAPTLAQCLFLIQQSLHEFAIAGTTRTVKKLDGSTTAATFALDSATAPTSTTRAS